MPKTLVQLHSRIAALRTLIVWEGRIQTKRVRALLGLSQVQASRLVRAFRDDMGTQIREEGLGYELKRQPGSYPDITQYLSLVGSDAAWVEDARILNFLEPTPGIIAPLRRACMAETGARISYASVTSGGVTERVIYPHTVVRLATRWHVRAWCSVHEDFRDFNLSRILAIEEAPAESAPAGKNDDVGWSTVVSLRISPHKDLTAVQASVLRAEYAQGSAMRRIECRAALIPYLVQALRVAVDPDNERPPAFQLQVSNPDDVRPYLFADARPQSTAAGKRAQRRS